MGKKKTPYPVGFKRVQLKLPASTACKWKIYICALAASTWGQPTDELSNPTGGDSLGIAQQVGPLVSKKPENRHGFGDPNIM